MVHPNAVLPVAVVVAVGAVVAVAAVAGAEL